MSDNELRWQLRQLQREIDPPRDLWPGIAERLQRPAVPRRRPWFAAFAVAASLCVAAGLAWQLRQPATPAPDFRAELVQREAEALTREYQAALDQFQGAPMPEPLAPGSTAAPRTSARRSPATPRRFSCSTSCAAPIPAGCP
jgi:ferric-dicitrate binding protein FerR (iron transport regulator)